MKTNYEIVKSIIARRDEYDAMLAARRGKTYRALALGGGAAAACLVGLAVLSGVLRHVGGRQIVENLTPVPVTNAPLTAAPTGSPVTAVPTDAPQTPVPTALITGSIAGADTVVHMNGIVFNEMGLRADGDATRIVDNPELYEFVIWDEEEVRNYYGRDLTPAYIPDYLTPDVGPFTPAGNGTLQAIISKESGEVVEDSAFLGFFEVYGYFENGEPDILGNDIPAEHGILISASKIGLLTDCIYILPENEIKTSIIGETEVTFGYRKMSYGPYDDPRGYYDFIEAHFYLDGVEYLFHAWQMERNEFVKIVASFILGTDEIAVIE